MACLQVLDAPALQDDFYLNLLDWSPQGLLAVGLGTEVWVFNYVTSKVKSVATWLDVTHSMVMSPETLS